MNHKLYDEFIKPEIDPTEPYEREQQVIEHRRAKGNIVLEIFHKHDRLLGFRYQAWVAWRDAGNTVRKHSWRKFEPQPLVTDSISEAKQIAEAHAESIGIEFIQEWAG